MRHASGMVRPRFKQRQRRRIFLKEWRQYRQLSQERLADRAGVTQGLISQLEGGKADYSGTTLDALATALQCEPQDILMRNPLDTEAPWSIWETLPPTARSAAIDILKSLKKASG